VFRLCFEDQLFPPQLPFSSGQWPLDCDLSLSAALNNLTIAWPRGSGGCPYTLDQALPSPGRDYNRPNASCHDWFIASLEAKDPKLTKAVVVAGNQAEHGRAALRHTNSVSITGAGKAHSAVQCGQTALCR